MYLQKFMTRDINFGENKSETSNGDLIEKLFEIQNEGIDIRSDSKKEEVSIRETTCDEIKTMTIKRQKDGLSEIITMTRTQIPNEEEEERKINSFYRDNHFTQDKTAFVTGKSQPTISVKENNK